MIGQFFAHIAAGPNDQMNVRTGVVKSKVGPEHYMLEFAGRNYRFSNVFSAEKLQNFAFFDTQEALNAFIEELKQQTLPAPQATPPPAEEIKLS